MHRAVYNTTLLDCILNLMQYLYDLGILTSSASKCTLSKVYLSRNLSRKTAAGILQA